jgi:Glycosyl hydrolases family 11
MYGWTHSPCVEWYINDDSFNGLPKSGATATIDGATYYLTTNQTTGSGGNACESGHTGPWTQIFSYRQTTRQCGTITVSDHFAAWEKQGWSLGTLASVHINVEVGGGTGSIQFPVADVTTSSN